MAKKKDNPRVINNIQELNLEIDYDKLAEAIIKSKQIEEENIANKKALELEEWQRTIGVNKYENKKGIIKKFFIFFNFIKVCLNLIFFSKKNEVKISITGIFMQNITSMLFHMIKVMLWILSLSFVGICINHGNMAFGLLDYTYYIGFGIISFVLASLFRLMAIEVEQITERERIFGLFTAVMSVIPMIEIVVSFLRR